MRAGTRKIIGTANERVIADHARDGVHRAREECGRRSQEQRGGEGRERSVPKAAAAKDADQGTVSPCVELGRVAPDGTGDAGTGEVGVVTDVCCWWPPGPVAADPPETIDGRGLARIDVADSDAGRRRMGLAWVGKPREAATAGFTPTWTLADQLPFGANHRDPRLWDASSDEQKRAARGCSARSSPGAPRMASA